MSMLLWYGDGPNDAISLGSALVALPAFAEISRACEGESGWDDLLSVPEFAEQDVDADWLAKVRDQARRFTASHPGLGEDAKHVLAQLAG